MYYSKKLYSVPYQKYRHLQTKLRLKRKESVLFLEHLPVITAGKSFDKKNLLVTENYLKEQNIEFLEVERGGDLTAHEKGQLVIYLHIDLLKRNMTISEYLKILNDVLIQSIYQTWNLEVYSQSQKPGLYLSNDPEKKILSQGVYFKSNFTSFGVALNISNDLKVFQLIHPCGANAKNIISIKSLGLDTYIEKDFISLFKNKFINFFKN